MEWQSAAVRVGRKPSAPRRGVLVALVLATISGPAFGQSASTYSFSVEDEVINQCTGEAMVIALDGRVVARPSSAGGVHRYTIVSELHGSAIGDGTHYRFVGKDGAVFESDTAAAELELWTNVRILTHGGESTYIGYDQQTISIGETGEIEHVAHRFDFACD